MGVSSKLAGVTTLRPEARSATEGEGQNSTRE